MLLVLSLVLVSIPQIAIVKAQSTIYIKGDGSVEGTDKIQQEGNIYTCAGDLFDFIVVEKDDAVIDGVGYSLNGTGSGIGVYLEDKINVTIRNMQICGFDSGIHLQGYSENTIYGNRIAANMQGIHLEGNNNSVYGNIIMNNSIGIQFVNCVHKCVR